MVDRIMSWASGSGNRLPLPQTAFDAANGQPFTEENAGDKLALLKALQAAPSSANKQPWRFVVAGDVVHVFNARDTAMALFDIGIALAGINLYAKAARRTVAFGAIARPPQSPLGGKYIITATISPAPAAR